MLAFFPMAVARSELATGAGAGAGAGVGAGAGGAGAFTARSI